MPVPGLADATASRRITDRYLPGTRLRLRRVEWLDSDDPRFAGGTLARARRHDLLAWLGEYGVAPHRAG